MLASLVTISSTSEPNATTLNKFTTVASCQYEPIACIADKIAPLNTDVQLTHEKSYILLPNGNKIYNFHDGDQHLNYVDGKVKQ
jgi:hypothetical protein